MNGPSRALLKDKRSLAEITAQFQALLKRYAATRSLAKVKLLHGHTITADMLHSSLGSAEDVRPYMVVSYSRCGEVRYARKLFDELPQPGVVVYNHMMRICVDRGEYFGVLKMFVELLQLGYCAPDKYTFPLVFKACSELSSVELGRVIHGQTLMSKFGSGTIVQNSLLAMYMNCGQKEEARKVFDAMKEKSVVSWNTMINGYFKNGCAQTALVFFNQMVDFGVEIDGATAVSVLPACASLKKLNVGRRVHAAVEKKVLGNNIVVRNALVDMYVKCGSMEEAKSVFDGIVEKDVVSWTSMINGYILSGDVRKALVLCKAMQIEGIRPNSVTIASLLSACASLKYLNDGRCLHGWVMRQKLDSEVVVETSLIDMYAKCNCVEVSFGVFARTSRKRAAPWSAMLSGYNYNGLAAEAVGLFKQMLMEGVKPYEVTFNSLLPAYATLADLQLAMNLHCYLMKSGFLSTIEIATSLIDIYSKCGNLEFAHKVFNAIPEEIKDIFSWSVIIGSYGVHGHGKTAVSLFSQMVQSGIKANEITFTSVLHACSHSGLVDEGLNLFKLMLKDQKTNPGDDHYTCIVDLLGRAGRLNEAYDLMIRMPFRPSHAVWGALLGACVIHGNVELGEIAAKWLFELEPENTGNFVLLAKLYSALGRWEDAENVRHLMNDVGIRKEPAHSLIEVRKM
ncbi:hypothetical protein K2173_014135 [Erythroxylum novogranatense]|uniref:Pentatricopeptide repeat-containing protein n=1 Tax=Erythroxylum novogranatense TaxID=1862640 RepID=A0AAV8SDG2_9ROSI|nr:hypothetical protein K2173_014135 [Erythroxylum novogranatense]